ncbi:MAG TPA: response regulator, partial [Deltaproteobacteria bacterium]|nr:response regulator [Deltaproteobacteria bacterium]
MMNEPQKKAWKILIADDNRHVNEVVRETLSEYGFEVLQAFDGRQAYVAFEEKKPDLVFLDYLMP